MGWIYLTIAVIFEVAAASCLKYTDRLSKPLPSILVVVFYIICFVAMIKALETLPLGLMYAIWGGVGTALVAVMSWYLFKENMQTMKVAGIGLIVVGVILANLAKTDPDQAPGDQNHAGMPEDRVSEPPTVDEKPSGGPAIVDP